MNRRELIKNASKSGALVSVPVFLNACTSKPLASAPENPFLSWFGIDQAMMNRVLQELSSNGADHADLFFQHVKSSSIAMENGKINRARTSIEQGVGVRSVVGSQTGFAFTENLTLPAMLSTARSAAAIAKKQTYVHPKPLNSISSPNYYKTQLPLSEIDVSMKLDLIRAIEKQARAIDPAVSEVNVYWGDSDERVMVATLDGRLMTDRRPMSSLSLTLVLEKNGERQSNRSSMSGRFGIDEFTPAQITQLIKQTYDNTEILFSAQSAPSGEYPVLVSGGGGGMLLHEAIGHGMEADFNRRKESAYTDLMNQQVANKHVTIVDQGNLAKQRGSLNFDDEGHLTQRNVLVENGKLRSYLHDSISAKHYQLPPTGSGRRESYRHAPMPRMTSTFMENGPHAREEMIATIKKGIIADTFTNGRVDIAGGDFTFFVKNGWLVENGKITAPVKNCNLIGNGPKALDALTMVGNDKSLEHIQYNCGKNGQMVPVSIGMPSVLVASLTVGGM